jgi:hypothetical protein
MKRERERNPVISNASPHQTMKLLKSVALSLLAAALGLSAQAEETVKVGVLHSLSGTMAISETSLRDVLLFTFDEINKSRRRHGQEDRARQSSTALPTGRSLPRKPSSSSSRIRSP